MQSCHCCLGCNWQAPVPATGLAHLTVYSSLVIISGSALILLFAVVLCCFSFHSGNILVAAVAMHLSGTWPGHPNCCCAAALGRLELQHELESRAWWPEWTGHPGTSVTVNRSTIKWVYLQVSVPVTALQSSYSSGEAGWQIRLHLEQVHPEGTAGSR